MPDRFEAFLRFLQQSIFEPLGRLGPVIVAGVRALSAGAWRMRVRITMAAILAALGYALYRHPPFESVHRSEVLVRTNVFDGSAGAYSAGTVLVLPGIHQVRRYPTRIRCFARARARGRPGPLRSSRTRVSRSVST